MICIQYNTIHMTVQLYIYGIDEFRKAKNVYNLRSIIKTRKNLSRKYYIYRSAKPNKVVFVLYKNNRTVYEPYTPCGQICINFEINGQNISHNRHKPAHKSQ